MAAFTDVKAGYGYTATSFAALGGACLLAGAFNPIYGFAAAGYCASAGSIVSIGEVEVGVPLLLGKRVKGLILPPGYSAWLPWPFGGVRVFNMAERTTEFSLSKGTGVDEVITRDDAEVKVSATFQWQVVDPYLASGVENINDFFYGAVRRQIRWYGTLFDLKDIVLKKMEFSKFLQGLDLNVGGVDLSRPENEDHNLVKILAQRGIRINKAMVHNISQPQEVSDAAGQVRVEERQRESEAIQVDARINQARSIVEASRGADGKATISFKEAMSLAMAEVGKIDRVEVGSSGNPIADAAALFTSSKRK